MAARPLFNNERTCSENQGQSRRPSSRSKRGRAARGDQADRPPPDHWLIFLFYILTYIDEVELRQSVQKALNRGEAYHRFRRAISYVNAGKFRVKTEAEQHIWNECSRLIANAVMLLSRVYAQKQAVRSYANESPGASITARFRRK